MGITAPQPLTIDHNLDQFSCGKQVLDDWLRNTALKNHSQGGSRTFVITDEETNRVIGYYCISTGSIEHNKITGKFKRNMPDPIPVILLGRLAVDVDYANRGIGTGLMKDCYKRVVSISTEVGVRAILVHAIDDESRQYYLKLGFSESPIQSHTLMIRVKDIVTALE